MELEGYTYVPELTDPAHTEILPDESLVVCLYYTLNRVPYVIEHYKQDMIPGENGESWTLADTETLQGIPGTEAEYPAKDYPGYSIDLSLTEPSDRHIPADGSLVIRMYYIQAPFDMLVAPIHKAVSSTLPLAASLGAVISGGFFLLKLYRRISDKA